MLQCVCWLQQTSGRQGTAECVSDILTTFLSPVIFSYTDQAYHGIYLFYMSKKKNVGIGDVSYNICPRIDHK